MIIVNVVNKIELNPLKNWIQSSTTLSVLLMMLLASTFGVH